MFNLTEMNKKKNNLLEQIENNYSDQALYDFRTYCRISLFCYNKKDDKYKKEYLNLVDNFDFYMNSDYDSFLNSLSEFVKKNYFLFYDPKDVKLRRMKLSLEELIDLSKEFYCKYFDEEFSELACKIYEDSNSMNVCKKFYDINRKCFGLTFYDHTNNIPYPVIRRTNTLIDAQSFNHEVMHAIDFYMQPKYFDKYNNSFCEIVTYAIDYIFLDFLEEKKANSNEIDKLRIQKMNYILSIIKEIKILNKIYRDSGFMINSKNDLLKEQMKLEATVISYLMYEKYLNGDYISDFKKLIHNVILRSEKPDFNFIGFTDDMILEKSKIYVKKYVEMKNLTK